MWTAVVGATLQVLVLDGAVPLGGGDYELVSFEVPEGVAEIEIAHAAVTDGAVLDFGLWGPGGFRGWGGGLEDNAIVGAEAASRGYLPGPIEAGRWTVVVGKAKMPGVVDMALEVTLRDEATLAASERVECEERVASSEPGWYAGDFHVHSRESGDASATLDEIAELARDRGLDFAVITDHNTVSNRGLICARDDAELLLLPGVEVTTYAGHGNAFGIERYVDHRIGHDGRSAADIVADVRDQGGLFMVNHPVLELGSACIGCAWDHDDVPWDQVAAIEIATGDFDVTGTTFTPVAIAMWDGLLDQGHRITALGGSDDHRAGNASAISSAIGNPTTMLRLDELSERGVLDAVAAGRAIVKLRGPDDPDVELVVRGAGSEAGIGGTIAASSVTVEATVEGGAGLDVALIEDGIEVGRRSLSEARESLQWKRGVAEAGHRYRVQVLDRGDAVVVTNHVFVEHAVGEGGGCAAASRAAGTGVPALLALTLMLVAVLAGAGRRTRVHR